MFFLMYMMVNSYFEEANKQIYSDLIKEINKGTVTKLIVSDKTVTAIIGDANKPVERLPDGTVKLNKIEVEIPSIEIFHADVGDEINRQIEAGTLEYDVNMPKSAPWWLSMIGPLILVGIVIFFWMFTLQQQGGGRAGGFTRSRAKVSIDEKRRVGFNEVAGAEEEKAELEELVEFLKNPQKFIALGARIPKGVLLVGPPGTGKTLLARAVAGEAGVPFFSISGSDFVELYVGVGASRVRDLFEQAKKNRPCIIFIDEIDAVGRHRGAGMGGGHDEREQTLNQLLVEMDGFGANEGIIIIAATNRPDILDPALLRPGRFDRQVVVDVPDVKGREEILKVHSRKKPLSKDVDLKKLARATAGYTGADLENLMNEAAIFAARRNKTEIDNRDLEDANIKVMMGSEKKSKVITDKEKRLTAYHEAGHAILAKLVDSTKIIHQVSIIPRGRAGGYTMYLPTEDKMYSSKNEMLDSIIVLLGGRVAEKIVLDDVSTGASNDIQRATDIARQMVAKYGMSDKIGPVSYDSGQEVFLGRDYGHAKNYSEQTAAEIDKEVSEIIEKQYEKTMDMLKGHIEELERIAQALLKYETIDGAQFEEIFNGGTIEEENIQ
ncbi:MAG: ATP-dependent zinc metalloprotease FtsH [Clostridia bacterium]|nr:ATP-dependent zinc metalloprotease FtsH [Clostridia bacterium]